MNKSKFNTEKEEIISRLNEIFIPNSITYTWCENKKYGDMFYNQLVIATAYKLNDGAVATRRTIINNNLTDKEPQPIYDTHVLVEVCKDSGMFSLRNNDDSDREFKNWRFQILKSDL